MNRVLVILAVVGTAILAGCGGGGGSPGKTTASGPNGVAGTADPGLAEGLRVAAEPVLSDFPQPRGRTLNELSSEAKGQVNLGLSTATITPGTNRLAFALIGKDNHFVYGPSVVYVSPRQDAPAEGPYLAPIDSMVTDPQFESKTVAGDSLAIRGVYQARARFSKPGVWAALTLTQTPKGLVGALTQFSVEAKDPIIRVGQPAPRIHTPTVKSAGSLAAVDTRVPHDDMHRTDFADVIGKRPVVLLIATPLLCQSRVCGPVTDIELQMEHEFAGKAVFIHQEVYRDNEVNKGLRPQLIAFKLRTEPWLFTFDRRGRLAARIEGAFGLNEFRAAVRAALR